MEVSFMTRKCTPTSLNPTQEAVLEFLVERTQIGLPPSIREIMERVGLKSTSSVQAILETLENRGFIERDLRRKRTVRVVGQQASQVSVPLLGTVTAGAPILAVEEIEGYLPYAGSVTRDKALFALRVKGESMVNAGILDGDIIFVERGPTAEDGEIVVALLDDEATCKRFFRERGYYRLQPENDTMEPIFVKEVTILGRVVGLSRFYR
jgi:repressor LexA